MVEGEFLTADDLGPLGRLVARGELVVLEDRDVEKVRQERDWIRKCYTQADRKAEALRGRLRKGAALGEHAEEVRESFRAWTLEAAKLSLCDRWLASVEAKLSQGERQAMKTPRDFRWESIPQVTEVVQRVINATDDEIIGGVIFRAS